MCAGTRAVAVGGVYLCSGGGVAGTRVARHAVQGQRRAVGSGRQVRRHGGGRRRGAGARRRGGGGVRRGGRRRRQAYVAVTPQ